MKKILKNKKLAQDVEKLGIAIPRCYWRKSIKKGAGYIMTRVLIKCGCCDNKVEIYYNKEKSKDKIKQCIYDQIEINGVLADKKWWKELFKEIGIIE